MILQDAGKNRGGWGKRELEKREGKQREEREYKIEGGKTERQNERGVGSV